METVLVFGGFGFIGLHVIRDLLGRGCKVMIFDRQSCAYVAHGEIIEFKGDITDENAVDEAMFKCDKFINLAGILGTSETVNNPMPAISTNIVGGMNVLMAARRHKKKGVQITVGNHFMNNSYAISKTTQERFTLMFNKEHGTKIAVVRAMNAYGIGQKSKPVRKIMPNFIKRAINNEPIEIYGDGTQVMDMIHVTDIAKVLVDAAFIELDNYNQVIEVGSGVATTVNEIAEKVIKHANSKSEIVHLPMRAGEVPNAVVLADVNALRVMYSELPKLKSLDESLPEIIDFYKANDI